MHSAYVQTLMREHKEARDFWPTEEDYNPPTLHPQDGKLLSRLLMPALSYYLTENAFIKREPSIKELDVDKWGNQAVNPYIRDRLQIEAAALKFVVEHSTIPVPRDVRL